MVFIFFCLVLLEIIILSYIVCEERTIVHILEPFQKSIAVYYRVEQRWSVTNGSTDWNYR